MRDKLQPNLGSYPPSALREVSPTADDQPRAVARDKPVATSVVILR
jgi:hypothetical protein